MRLRNLFFMATLVSLAFTACDNENESTGYNGNDGKYVLFSGTIENQGLKASGTTWGSGDAIGVYMKTAGAELSAGLITGSDNVKYTTTGDGVFKAATQGIELPADGSKVDFISYYPYQTTLNNFIYPINTADQSSLPNIDLLYSNNALNADKNNATVAMNFKHMLSQLVLNVSAGDGVTSLTGLTLSVANVTTDGTFDLKTGTSTIGTTKATITPPVSISTNAVVNAILVPGQNLKDTKLTFALGGKSYIWEPTAQVLESGKKYTYNIQVSLTGIVSLNPNATIEDWIEGNPGGSDIIITPSEDPSFVLDKPTVTLEGTTLTETIKLTAPADQTWTATVDAASTWLTVAPASGMGTADITVTAEENTTGADRTATVTIAPTTRAVVEPVTITITQKAKSVGPTESLLFPGSNFEDWDAFLGCLNSYGLSKDGYASQSTTEGRNGTSALYLKGTPSKNDYTFTATLKENMTVKPNSISFYIKGTSAKSLSLNVYVGTGNTMGTDYKCYNLKDITSAATMEPTNTNDYLGVINTNGEWVKVTLNVGTLTLNSTAGQNVFALKVGRDAAYDLLVDDITFE